MTMSAKIRRYLAKGKSADYIAKTLGVSKNYVWTVIWKEKQKAKVAKPEAKRKPGRPKKATEQVTIEEWAGETKPDPVNHPPHYKAGGIEVIDFIEAKDLNYRLGNAVKYISRAGRKDSDPVQDLEKAAWYLKREIDARKGA